jgi:hypothetical protein
MFNKYKNSKFWLVVIGLFVSVVLPFIPLILDNKVINWGTSSLQFLPWLNYSFDAILHGELPLWNPLNGLGSPLLANYQCALFYPLNWFLILIYKIFGIKGLASGLTLSIVLHLYFSSLGMSTLLKYLKRSYLSCYLGGMIWAFSGYAISRISFFTMIWSFSWVSWIILGVFLIRDVQKYQKIKWGLILSVLFSMQLLSGHAQTSYFTIILAALFMLFPVKIKLLEKVKNLFRLFSAIFVSILLSSIQLIPTIEYLRLSQRSQEVGFDYAANFSYWPLRIISTIFGNFWGHPGLTRFFGGGTFWEDNLYIGVFPFLLTIMILIIIVRKRKASLIIGGEKEFILGLFVISVIAFLFSLGKNFVLFPFFYKYVPTFNMFQAPSRFLIISSFCLSIISAFAFDYWKDINFNPRKAGLLIVSGFAIIISIVISKYIFQAIPKEIYQSIWIGSSLIIGFGGITIIKNYLNPKNKQILILLFVGICCLDLLVHNFPYGSFTNLHYLDNIVTINSKFINKVVFIDRETEEFLKFNRFYRFDRFQNIGNFENAAPILIPNTNLISPNYKMLNNFDPFVPDRYNIFLDWLNRLDIHETQPILKMLGVTDLIHLDINNAIGIEISDLTPKEIVQWYECSVMLPSDETLDWILYNESYRPNDRCITIENQNSGETFDDAEFLSEVEIIFEQINSKKISINYSSKKEGWIVIRQVWYPGWIAKLDSKNIVKIDQVDFMFQGVLVPPGTHSIVFEYKPLTFIIGFYISIVCWIIIILIGFKIIISKSN